MPEQKLLLADNNYKELDDYLYEITAKRILLVCGKSIELLEIGKYFNSLESRTGIKIIKFFEFFPNPSYDSVVEGIKKFQENKCDTIIAVGGGSSIDVAKCIKLYSNLNSSIIYLEQSIAPNNVPLIAIPTTAGTGSEATKFAVIYYNGEKQSVSHFSCIPQAVLLDSSTLETLPDYQRKVTMLDAICHALESFWSVNSTIESKEYSAEALYMIWENKESYLANEKIGNRNMLNASYLAGKAINLAQTTAGHAMSYKLTNLYKVAHGHAVSLCISVLWPYMVNHVDNCSDYRGSIYLYDVFKKIAEIMGCEEPMEAVQLYQNLLCNLNLKIPDVKNNRDFQILKTSVNPIRLKNNPIRLDIETIDNLYHQLLKK